MEDTKRVEQLVTDFRTGTLSRRQFLKRATLLLGGATAANALLMAAAGAPIPHVARAAGALQGTAAATPPATMAATEAGLEIKTETVTFKGNGDLPGYLARPTAEGSYPGVIVIQEWWGVDDHIKDLTERFARQGYVALAPDLYRGEVAKEPSDAQRLVMTVQLDQAFLDIQGAVDYLNQQEFVAPKNKVGVVGFCFGGGLAMMMSYRGTGVGAVAVFYGNSRPTDTDLQNVKVPIIGFFGDQDRGFPAETINHWADVLKSAGKINQMTIYKGAPHAFFNNTRPSYRNLAVEDSWAKTLAWFENYLVEGEVAATPEANPVATANATEPA
jgi:carboxymethylenebutenolidase